MNSLRLSARLFWGSDRYKRVLWFQHHYARTKGRSYNDQGQEPQLEHSEA